MIENLFSNVPTDLPEKLVQVLVEDQHVRIEKIISTGQYSPPGFWYDQAEHEWVVVLKGEAMLRFQNPHGYEEPSTMKPGDHVLIPAHKKHRVEWTKPYEPTLWLAVFFQED